jgi:uncharacterized repeat protein (TIGR03803 family)
MKLFIPGAAALIALLCPLAGAGAYTETVLYRFAGGADGAAPTGKLLADSTGALYGATATGGGSSNCTGGCGTVFKLTPPAAGQTTWTETVLYSFPGNAGSNPPNNLGPNGQNPIGSLVSDASGALYGATVNGGSHFGGVVYKLSPPAAGQTAWTETTIYDPAENVDAAGVEFVDGAGKLYVMTGGPSTAIGLALGTLFTLSPPRTGKTAWTPTLIADLANIAPQGWPLDGLVSDQNGTLYGLSFGGGAANLGTVYSLTPPAKRSGTQLWSSHILHSFSGPPFGQAPGPGGLIFGSNGNLYETTTAGGYFNCGGGNVGGDTAGCGTAFRLEYPQEGSSGHQLYKFRGGADGAYPNNGMITDASGAFYGTTRYGGRGCQKLTSAGCGTVFKLMPANSKGATFTESVLYAFKGDEGVPADGWQPQYGLIADSAGALYGTTKLGGGDGCAPQYQGCGTVFMLTP